MTTVPDDVRAKAERFNTRLYEIFEHSPLMDNPTIQTMFADAIMQERERCAQIALSDDLLRHSLSKEESVLYEAGQVDASWSIARAIRTPSKAGQEVKPNLTAHDLAVRAFEESGGPTPELRRVYETYLASLNRITDRDIEENERSRRANFLRPA